MTQREHPIWLSQVQNVADNPALGQARKAMQKAMTLDEQADAERVYIAAVLATIADEMAAKQLIS
jgi:hypothetical protein